MLNDIEIKGTIFFTRKQVNVIGDPMSQPETEIRTSYKDERTEDRLGDKSLQCFNQQRSGRFVMQYLFFTNHNNARLFLFLPCSLSDSLFL